MTAAPRVSRWEFAAAVLTLFMFAEAFLPRLLSPPPAEVGGDIHESPFLRYLWLPFYGLIGTGLFLAGRQVWGAIRLCAS